MVDRKNAEIPALILVGGLGTRLRSAVPTGPKSLAKVGQAPFLDLLVRQLRHQGVRRIIMCTGYLADYIEREFGDGRDWDVSIEYSREFAPQGTGGAIRLAKTLVEDAAEFFAMNGDSFLEVDFRQLLDFHRQHDGVATLAARRVEDASRYGSLRVGSSGRVRAFEEKSSNARPGLINGGVYMFDCSVLQEFPEGPASLERDVFPRLLNRGLYCVEQHGMFIDIGTPEDYERAQQICEQLYGAAAPPAGIPSSRL
jgi:NDP-sugar pyrophosphorylase family protein